MLPLAPKSEIMKPHLFVMIMLVYYSKSFQFTDTVRPLALEAIKCIITSSTTTKRHPLLICHHKLIISRRPLLSAGQQQKQAVSHNPFPCLHPLHPGQRGFIHLSPARAAANWDALFWPFTDPPIESISLEKARAPVLLAVAVWALVSAALE